MPSSPLNFYTTPPLQKQDLQNIAFENADIAIFMLDTQTGLIVACNHKASSNLGISPENMLGRPPSKVYPTDFSSFINSLLQGTYYNNPVPQAFFHRDNKEWLYVTLKEVTLDTGLTLAIFSVADVSGMQSKDISYLHLAYYDTQLNIPNGNKLEEDFKKIVSFEHVALVHFDINRFSIINEVFGWATGDFLLTQIRDWMLATAVPGCTLYRVNNGQFALLIQDITFAGAKKRAKQVVDRFKEPWQTLREGSLPLYCTITMGLMYGNFVRGDVRNQLFRLLNAADSGLAFTVYDAKLDKEIKHRFLLRQSLITCMQQDMKGFSLVYQPIVNPKTGVWTGAEALCRWVSPEVGPVPPNVFVRIIEDVGLAGRLDRWVLETALKECGMLALNEKAFLLDINLSPLQSLSESFLLYLQNILRKNKFPTFKLCLEITEAAKFDFSPQNLSLLQKMLDSGIQIALDDFGTGYSTFQNLIRLPAHILKIEKSFIDSLVDDPYLKYLLKMMLDLAHAAKMRVVVEGVETPEQQKLVTNYGADFIQGYYYSKPLSMAELEKNLKNFR
ncbi:MAG: EAL domain-containing protein [Oscillospiraceae bacterium]